MGMGAYGFCGQLEGLNGVGTTFFSSCLSLYRRSRITGSWYDSPCTWFSDFVDERNVTSDDRNEDEKKKERDNESELR
jgi:hypothetical protein